MIKKLIKIFLYFIFLLILFVAYLSIFGINTNKFNNKIKNEILGFNPKVKIELKKVKILLNLKDLLLEIKTLKPIIIFENQELPLEEVKTSVSIKSLITKKFSINNLNISTKKINLSDIILLARSLKNSTELFLLNKIIKDGFLIADIKLKFDKKGNIKNDFRINGLITDGKINFLNKLNTNNLNLNFDISKNKYFLTEVSAEINDVKFLSPLIEINEKKNLFSVKGKILTNEKEFDIKQLSLIFPILLKNQNIEKARFTSENNISFNFSKKLKLNDLNIKSKINLEQLVVKNSFIDLKPYLPALKEVINFENHKITINYDKDKLDIKGNGKILIKDKLESVNYGVKKINNKFTFETEAKIKNSKLLIDFLDYEKKDKSDASILIKGNFKSNSLINFDLISLIEKKNIILFNNLKFRKDFKVISLDSFNFNYLNNRKIKNKLILKKNNSNYFINGESFDATQLINKLMDSNNDEESSLFANLNNKIILKINKTYIDEENFVNNLSGVLNFKNNRIDDLDLKSTFPNNKIISISIKKNNQQEKITKLFTDYPKPLVKRYDFIKGFDEGYLDYYSIQKDGKSNSKLIIDNFKVKEVPVFAKILSLASLQGIADLLTGEGIRFTDFEMKFSNIEGLTTIEEMYAIGPAVSILMDGYVQSKKLVSLRGTLVPATTINRTIASIPVLGNILVGKKTGEGVFGVSFKIKGAPKNLKTTVNPIKTLTPRFITRTLEKIKKN